MTRQHQRLAAIGLCVATLLCAAPHPIAAFADSGKSVPARPGLLGQFEGLSDALSDRSATDFGLLVSPTRLIFGQSEIAAPQEIRVINRGQDEIAVAVQKRNFSTSPDGSLTYQEDAPYAAAEWVSVTPANFRLKAGASQTVKATVELPENPDSGDHQLAIIFLVPAAESDANIKINRGIGMSVFITVPGPVDDSVTLQNLSASAFATSGPVMITASVKNTGTVHRDYRGQTPLLVDAPGDTLPFPDFTVARGSTRDISTTWDPPLIGIFNPTVTLTNADGTTVSRSVQVIVFPIQKALILLGILLVLFLGVWFIRRRYRSSVMKAAAALNRPVGRGDA